jgi:hypothetical protein
MRERFKFVIEEEPAGKQRGGMVGDEGADGPVECEARIRRLLARLAEVQAKLAAAVLPHQFNMRTFVYQPAMAHSSDTYRFRSPALVPTPFMRGSGYSSACLGAVTGTYFYPAGSPGMSRSLQHDRRE